MPLLMRFVAALTILASAAATSVAQNAEPPETEQAPTDDPSTWRPEVKKAYDEILALPATPKDTLKDAMLELAGKGRLARPAIAAIARQADLPEPHRVFGGVLVVRFARFDVAALRKLAVDANPFAQNDAIVFLSTLGGTENAEFLADLAKKTTTDWVKRHVEGLAKKPPVEPLPARALELLDKIINADADAKKLASAILAEDFGKAAASALAEIVPDPVADDDTRTFAAIALVQVNSESVPDLESLCARKNHKTLRYCAVVELAKKGAEGEAVLRKLAGDPTEPLKKRIDALLEAPRK